MQWERELKNLEERERHDELTRRVSGASPAADEEPEAAEFHPLTRAELKAMLLRRKPQETKQ